MAGVSEPNGGQMAEVKQPNPEQAPEVSEPNRQPRLESGPEGSGAGGLTEAMRAIQERQERDYQRYVKAYRDYHEHAETYRDWVVGGVRIRARETACTACSDAGTRVYDANSLPRLPLAECTGDGDGYCTCTYVVALRRASSTALATEVVTPPPATAGAPSVVPGLCPSCGAVLLSGAAACRVCGTPSPAVIAMGLSPERPGAPRSGMADLPPGRNRWLRTLLGGGHGSPAPTAQTGPDGSPAEGGAAVPEVLVSQGRGPGKDQGWSLPLAQPLQRASYRLTRKWHRLTATLSADMGIIRVVVFKGHDVVAWGLTKPDEEPDLSEQGTVSQEERTATAVLDLLDQLHVRRERRGQGVSSHTAQMRKLLEPLGLRRNRMVTDFPLYDTLLRHLQLPRVAQSYLEPMIVSEVLESIPFSKSEVDIAWHTRRQGPTQSVFAVAVPKERVDRQVGLLKGAGVAPQAGYSRAEALAFAAGLTEGILVHLEPSHASVVLVQRSLPRVVHQVVFAPGEDGARNRAELLARGVDQVSGYYHTLGSGEDSGTWPLVLTGGFSESLATALQQLSQRRTVTFGPELAWPEHFLPEEYAVNLGLFLAYQARPKDYRSRVVKSNWVPLNLLADRHMPRMVPISPVAVFITLLLLWLHPFNVGAHVEDKLVATGALSGQIDVLKTRAQQYRANQALEKATQKETQELYRQRQILQLHLDELEGRMDSLLARLEAMTTTSLPPTMRLTSLIQRADEFALVGTAASYDEVLAYTANLRATGLFSDASVLKVDGWEDPDDPTAVAVSFQVEAKVPVAVPTP